MGSRENGRIGRRCGVSDNEKDSLDVRMIRRTWVSCASNRRIHTCTRIRRNDRYLADSNFGYTFSYSR